MLRVLSRQNRVGDTFPIALHGVSRLAALCWTWVIAKTRPGPDTSGFLLPRAAQLLAQRLYFSLHINPVQGFALCVRLPGSLSWCVTQQMTMAGVSPCVRAQAAYGAGGGGISRHGDEGGFALKP